MKFKRRILDIEGMLFDNELAQSLDFTGIVVFQVIMALAEDWGGIEIKIDDICLRFGALSNGVTKELIQEKIDILINREKIIPYKAGKRTLWWLVNWFKYQSLRNNLPPKLPLPKWITCELKQYEKTNRKYAKYTLHQKLIPVETNILPEVIMTKEWVCLEETKKVVDYFNEAFKTKHTYAYETCKQVQARIAEGSTADDCIQVIETKRKDNFFKTNPKLFNFKTLFKEENFNKYLNEVDSQEKSNIEKAAEGLKGKNE